MASRPGVEEPTKDLPDIGLPSELRKLLGLLGQVGFFEKSAIIGSWVMPIYRALHGVQYVLRTLDLDLAVHLARRGKAVRADLAGLIADMGFTDYFTADGWQKFSAGGYEVDFMVKRPGGKDTGALKVPEWNITALPLPFIDILIDFSETARLDETVIRYPVPEAFFLHKLLVAPRRLSEAKRRKDLDQCLVLTEVIDDTLLREILRSRRLSGKTRKSLEASCEAIDFTL